MLDFDRLADAVVTGAKRYVDKALTPVLERLAAIEARTPEKGERGEKGDPGRDGEPGRDGADGKDGRDGADGKDGEPGAQGPQGERGEKGDPGQDGAPGRDGSDGKDGRDGEPGPQGERGEKGEPGRDGRDGASVDPANVERMIAEAVAKAMAAIQVPKDGAPGRDGKDGVGVAGALLDRGGNLVLTLTDGSTRDLGLVVGRDGAPGEKGVDGKNGRDGFSLDDFDLEKKDDRTVILKFTRGDVAEHYELHFPVMIYRGVWREGEAYERGDTVTWGGSLWHCDHDTTDKPDGQQKHWTLAAKRGRDGKDGVLAAEKPAAPIKLGGGK